MGKRLDVPLPKSDLELVLILDKVSHPGNLGAVCRAMMNFGFTQLRLINPQCSP
ncbi:MAG: TrmH family RNA methyltransferase, partial [Candidatus Poseidoniaceae archaeon]